MGEKSDHSQPTGYSRSEGRKAGDSGSVYLKDQPKSSGPSGQGQSKEAAQAWNAKASDAGKTGTKSDQSQKSDKAQTQKAGVASNEVSSRKAGNQLGPDGKAMPVGDRLSPADQKVTGREAVRSWNEMAAQTKEAANSREDRSKKADKDKSEKSAMDKKEQGPDRKAGSSSDKASYHGPGDHGGRAGGRQNLNVARERQTPPARGDQPRREMTGKPEKSVIDGSVVSADRLARRVAARQEFARLSPEARRQFFSEANKVFWKQNPEFNPKKSGTDGKLDDRNPDHKTYRENYLKIRDELMTRTGKDHWERPAAEFKGTAPERRSSANSRSSDKGTPPLKPSDATATPRQDKIWPDGQDITGKQFQKHVDHQLNTEARAYGASRQEVAFRIAGSLKDADLASKEMRTPEGKRTLQAMEAAMAKPQGVVDDVRNYLVGERRLNQTERYQLQRIRGAITEINKERYPRASHQQAEKTFDKNFPKFEQEVKRSIEAKGAKDNADIWVEKVYHKPFANRVEEIRAVISRREVVATGLDGRTAAIRTKKDICLGGVDLRRNGEFISPNTIEKHGTAESWKWERDIIAGAVGNLVGRYLIRSAVSVGARVLGTAGRELGNTTSLGGAAGRALGREASESSLGTAQRLERVPAGAYARTEKALMPKRDMSPDAYARTEKAPMPKRDMSPDAYARTEKAPMPKKDMSPKAYAKTELGKTEPLESHAVGGPLSRRGPPTEPPLENELSQGLQGDVVAWKAGRAQTPNRVLPGLSGYENYLGKDLHARAQRLGMDDDAFFHYVDRNVYHAEVLKRHGGGDFTGVQPAVQRTVAEDISKIEAFSAQTEVKKAINNGIAPNDLAQLVNDSRAKGFTDGQTARYLQKRNEYIDYVKREFCGNDQQKVRELVRASEASAEVALRSEYWGTKVRQWNANHPDEAPGAHRLKLWSDEADTFAKQKTKEFMDRP